MHLMVQTSSLVYAKSKAVRINTVGAAVEAVVVAMTETFTWDWISTLFFGFRCGHNMVAINRSTFRITAGYWILKIANCFRKIGCCTKRCFAKAAYCFWHMKFSEICVLSHQI